MEHATRRPLGTFSVLFRIFRRMKRPFVFWGSGLLSGLETAGSLMAPVLLQGLIRSVSHEGSAALGWSLVLAAALWGLYPLICLGGRQMQTCRPPRGQCAAPGNLGAYAFPPLRCFSQTLDRRIYGAANHGHRTSYGLPAGIYCKQPLPRPSAAGCIYRRAPCA